MKNVFGLILSLMLILPLAVACSQDGTTDPEFIDGFEFSVEFGNDEITATQINSSPEGDNVVIYTRDYKIGGAYSYTIGEAQEGRTALSVRCVKTDGGIEFDIVDRSEDTSNIQIPVNGFAISLPTTKLSDIRANKGQLVKVNGYESVVSDYERHDYASLAPDYYLSTATRRVNYSNPIIGFIENKIYYINSEFDGPKEITCDNVVVTAKLSTNYSYEIISISKMSEIPVPDKDVAYFVFTGEYNIGYANHYLNSAERISFSMIEKANSYTDVPAVVAANGVIEFNDETFNVESINDNGIYVFDNDYSASVTPDTNKTRKDVVIVNGYVAYVAENGVRTLIPDGNGFVITFVGEEALKKAEALTAGTKLDTFFIEFNELPEKYVEINNNYFEITRVDGIRAPEGVAILYTPMHGETTGSNEYGAEIVIEDGKVTEVKSGVGDATIPANGYVLSIHKDNPSFKNIKNVNIGDSVSVCLTGSDYSVTELKFDAINQTRLEDMLIVYRNKTSSGANEYGYEIAVDKNGFAVADGYNGNITIPEGGFALSGHGVNKVALENVYAIGERVLVNDKSKTVTIIRTPEQKLATASHEFATVSDRLEAAKTALLNLDYQGIDEQMQLLSSIIQDAEIEFKNYEFDKAIAHAESVVAVCENLTYSLIESKGVENRAVWHRSYEKSDEEVRATVEKMKSLNVNAVYLETWYEGYCIGSKVDVDGITTPAANGDYDALDGFVRICHEYGIEVHAWVHNFFVGFYYENGAEYYNPIFKDYKDKYLIDIKGRDYYYYSSNNNNFIFLNSNDRECRDLILNIYEQLVTKYEIDGLHLDYIRYPELNYGTDDFGYNKDIIEDFAAQTGITADPHYFVAGTAEHKAWIQFRCDIITDWMREVYEMVRENKPEIWLSAATYPDVELSKNTIAQDIRTFAEKGYLDEFFSMSYGVESKSVLSSVNNYVDITSGKAFYSAGIAAFLETIPMNFAMQLTEVEQAGADGVSVFSLGSISSDNYQLQMTNGAFRDPAVQVYKLSITAAAQMDYISKKADNIASICKLLDLNDIAFIKSECEKIKMLANEFDLENASISQKITWCEETIDSISTAKSAIIDECGDNSETKAIIADFEDLEYWLDLSVQRLETRK